MFTCTKCQKDFNYKYKGEKKDPICLSCSKRKLPPPVPIGVPYRCMTCRLEYMRKPEDPLQCFRCDAQAKHNLSRVSI